jgi:hypothetical protein
VILVKRLLNWDIKAGLVVGSPVNLSEILFFFFFNYRRKYTSCF